MVGIFLVSELFFNMKMMVDSVHGPLEARSTMDHSAVQTRGHRSEEADSLEFGLRPLSSSEARRRGSGVERGGL
jgi:hypothetical protein